MAGVWYLWIAILSLSIHVINLTWELTLAVSHWINVSYLSMAAVWHPTFVQEWSNGKRRGDAEAGRKFSRTDEMWRRGVEGLFFHFWCRTYSVAIWRKTRTKRLEVSPLKHWIHFLLSSLWPPTSNMLWRRQNTGSGSDTTTCSLLPSSGHSVHLSTGTGLRTGKSGTYCTIVGWPENIDTQLLF